MHDQRPAFDPDRTQVVLRAGIRCFGRYTLMRELGAGGMGQVWLARDEHLENEVALKFLREDVRHDPEAVRDLKREVRRCHQLTHPNIVRVHDFVEDARAAAISMEYVPGASLAARKAAKENGCFDAAELGPLVAQLCAALEHAHAEAKIVHRDIKPANLLVTDSGRLKVADFGIARSLAETQTRHTRDLRGTPVTLSFASPQQLAGEPPAPADDIYALGATLYDLLTGKPPFFRGDLLRQIETAAPVPLARRRAELENTGAPIPRAWEETIFSCLAKRAEDRPGIGDVTRRIGSGGERATTTASQFVSVREIDSDATEKIILPRKDDPVDATERIFLPENVSAGNSAGLAAFEVPSNTAGPEEARNSPPTNASPRPMDSHALLWGFLFLAAVVGTFSLVLTRDNDVPSEKKESLRPQSGQAWTIPELNLTLQPIAAGSFTMGSANGSSIEKPLTRVTLTQPFWIGRTEVTQREWQAVMGSNPSATKGDSLALENVSWEEAMEFCRKLTAREQAADRLPAGYAYTLPTEAQWEYACRAGTTGDYAGSLADMGWFSENSGGTAHTVATKRANAWGLHDMHGNVWEWCADWYGSYTGGSVRDPTGAPGAGRVFRGGSWASTADDLRSVYRNWNSPRHRINFLGFRVALSAVR